MWTVNKQRVACDGAHHTNNENISMRAYALVYWYNNVLMEIPCQPISCSNKLYTSCHVLCTICVLPLNVSMRTDSNGTRQWTQILRAKQPD